MPISARLAPSLRLATVLAVAVLVAACGKSRSEEAGTGGCLDCHGVPPASGAHLAHVNLTSLTGVSYGQEWITQDATPAHSQDAYSFGCGLCHPKDAAKHQNGTADVELSPADGVAGGLRARNGVGAAYNKGDGTCSNVYCHSSGQATPTYVTKTIGWKSGLHLTCNGCHGDPPSYPNGGPGASANSHIFLNWLGFESGHFAGLPGPVHNSRHGKATAFGASSAEEASPMTCQTCHADTVDPGNIAAGGFFYLDTGITTQLAGGAVGRLSEAGWKDTQCATCHKAGGEAEKSGKVRPLKHVNGVREVVFDQRPAPVGYFASLGANAPTRPYFLTSAHFPVGTTVTLPSDAGFDGTTLSYALTSATYTQTSMTCSSVACHLGRSAVWGQKDLETATPTCTGCHGP